MMDEQRNRVNTSTMKMWWIGDTALDRDCLIIGCALMLFGLIIYGGIIQGRQLPPSFPPEMIRDKGIRGLYFMMFETTLEGANEIISWSLMGLGILVLITAVYSGRICTEPRGLATSPSSEINN